MAEVAPGASVSTKVSLFVLTAVLFVFGWFLRDRSPVVRGVWGALAISVPFSCFFFHSPWAMLTVPCGILRARASI